MLATQGPDQSQLMSTLSASPNMVAGGSSTSLDAPQQAAPTHPFAVQAITNPLPPPVIHIDEDRHPACIAWINANNVERKARLAPSTPARTQGATPQINETLPYLPCPITSPQLLRCADENALLERAAGIFECALESQYSSAQRDRPTPTLQASGPHSTPYAASTVYTSQAAYGVEWGPLACSVGVRRSR